MAEDHFLRHQGLSEEGGVSSAYAQAPRCITNVFETLTLLHARHIVPFNAAEGHVQ
jgi:hypothetical protein